MMTSLPVMREDGALQDFVGGGRGEMAVIFEEILVVLGTMVHCPLFWSTAIKPPPITDSPMARRMSAASCQRKATCALAIEPSTCQRDHAPITSNH